jgi:oligoribonuclease NrnB/cAMP/cGMP phosphodiesterase (DHH superfamily)
MSAFHDFFTRPTMSTVIAYHKDCMDGLGAAAITKLAVTGRCPPGVVHLVPCKYQDDGASLGSIIGVAGQDSTLFVVDFSFSPEETLQLAGLFRGVVVIDHHETAIRRFAAVELPSNVETVFDTSRCGTSLCYTTFQADPRTFLYFPTEMPPLVSYIEDRDLWLKRLPDSDAVNAALYVTAARLPTSAEQVEAVLGLILGGHDVVRTLTTVGRAMLAARVLRVSAALELACRWCDADGTQYPCVNSTTKEDTSDLGHALAEKYPEAPFVLIWGVRADPSYIEVSVRARNAIPKSEVKTLDFVRRFGGGGHPHACGCKIPITEFMAGLSP